MGLLMIRLDDLALIVSVDTMKSLGENTKGMGGSSVLGLRYETMEREAIDLQSSPPIQEYFINSLPHCLSLEIKYHMV